jgi:hypothetical protein
MAYGSNVAISMPATPGVGKQLIAGRNRSGSGSPGSKVVKYSDTPGATVTDRSVTAS